MRKHLLMSFGVVVDGLIAAWFGVEAFAAASAVLGAACAWAYRQELLAGWHKIWATNRPAPALAEWQEFDVLPLKYAACMWHGLPPSESSLQQPVVQEELARLVLAVKQRKLEHRFGDNYHAMRFLLDIDPSNDQFTKAALVQYTKAAGRELPPFLRSGSS